MKDATHIDAFGVQHCKVCKAVIGQVNDFGDIPTDFVRHVCIDPALTRALAARDAFAVQVQKSIAENDARLKTMPDKTPDRVEKLIALIFIHAMMLWADLKEKFSRRKQ